MKMKKDKIIKKAVKALDARMRTSDRLYKREYLLCSKKWIDKQIFKFLATRAEKRELKYRVLNSIINTNGWQDDLEDALYF